MPESNPFVEVAAHLFLEDLAATVGTAGLNTYLIGLAQKLADAMPREEYDTWEEFLDALRSGRSILSTFEEVELVTPTCMVTRRSPFERGWREYAKRVGAFSPVHREVAQYYNAHVRPTAVTSLHIVHHAFREAAAKRVAVAGKPVRFEQIATAWVDGERQVLPKEKLAPLLARAGITETKLGMLLRTNAEVVLLFAVELKAGAAAGGA